MGYYTYHTVIVKGDIDVEAFKEDFEEVVGTPLEHIEADCYRWYDLKDDMEKLSSKYLNNLFIVTRDGENSQDFSKEYFYRGNHESTPAVFHYPEPNYNKLGDPYKHNPELFI